MKKTQKKLFFLLIKNGKISKCTGGTYTFIFLFSCTLRSKVDKARILCNEVCAFNFFEPTIFQYAFIIISFRSSFFFSFFTLFDVKLDLISVFFRFLFFNAELFFAFAERNESQFLRNF
jgi:hypothetical protein